MRRKSLKDFHIVVECVSATINFLKERYSFVCVCIYSLNTHQKPSVCQMLCQKLEIRNEQSSVSVCTAGIHGLGKAFL